MARTAAIFAIISLIFYGCTNTFKDKGGLTVFRYNESSGISSLDPAFARNQANIWAVNQMFNGLVQLDSNLRVLPCIAKKWDVSSDGKTYTFYIRDDVFFHNSEVFPNGHGRKVVASDIVYSLLRLADEKIASPGSWVLGNVDIQDNKKAINAIGDSVVTIKLKQPFPPFLGMLSMQYCSVIPKEAVDYYGPDFRVHPVGTGPFQFKMLKEGVKLVMVRNQNYFEFDSSGNKLPYLDAIAVTFIIDKQSAFLEFIKGNLDFMSGLDASYKDEVLTPSGKLKSKYAGKIKLATQPYLNTEYLGIMYDTNNPDLKNNPLRDERIRKALNMGFDRRKMIRYLRNGIGKPGIRGIIPDGLPGYNEGAGYGYEYDPGQASQLLAEAGYPGGKNLPPITISTNASYLDITQFIQSQLFQIGFNIKIDVSPPGTLRENIAQGRIAFFRGSWIADYPDAENYLSLFYSINKSPDGPNYTHFRNTKYDRLYEMAINQTDDSLRTQLYRQMDSLMMEHSPVIILFYDQVLRFTGKNISGLGSNPLNLLDLKRVKKVTPGKH
ncbi:MAG TPA: ABC transporter substrate-binding protein [Lentimicrobium sp.]|nr:ABC transporter substrate-binding protein [Lentimicrobium sp.]